MNSHQQTLPAAPAARKEAGQAGGPARSGRAMGHAEALWWIGLVCLALAVYVPSLRNGFIWDDDYYVTGNHTLRSAEGLKRIWFELGATPQYYPLVFTTFWAEYHLWGLAPTGYHAVNAVLHALNALLLWRVLRHLGVPGAWFVAAAFAVHPVHVESVAWVTERKNVLSGFFYLAAALAYFRFAGVEAPPAGVAGRWRWYGLAFGLFDCALLSKTVACSLPAAVLLVLWWKRGRLTRRDVVPLLPFFAVGLGLGLLTAWFERHYVRAEGPEWHLSFVERCLIAGRAVWFYAGKLAWPVPLTFIYPRWHIDTHSWWQYVFPAAALAVVLGLWFARGRLGRGPLVAVLFFGGTLLPALGFFNTYPMRYSFVADHFQYLASVGVIALAVAAFLAVLHRSGLGGARVAGAAGGVVLAALGFLTLQQQAIYKDREALWRDTLAKDPECWMAHTNLGLELARQTRYEEAVKQFRAAVDLKPDDVDARSDLGLTLARQGKLADAVRCYHEALKIDPNAAVVYNNLGQALAEQGKTDEAQRCYLRAARLNPKMAVAHFNLGTAFRKQDRLSEAVEQYQAALRVDPYYAQAHVGLGTALMSQGEARQAERHFREAVAASPQYAEAYNSLGNALLAQRKPGEAVASYREALRADPHYLQARYNLALVLLGQGKAAEAEEHFKKFLEAVPLSGEAHNNLGVALAQQDRPEEALQEWEKAVQLGPGNAEAQFNLAFAYFQRKRLDRAHEHARKAIDLHPAVPRYHSLMAQILRAQGKTEAAKDESSRARALEAEARRQLPGATAGPGPRPH